MTCIRICTVAGIIVAVLSAGLPALAQTQATNISQSLAPCVDAQTFAVVRIDLSRVDTDALFDLAVQSAAKYVTADQVAALKNKAGGPRQAMRQRLDAFKAAGDQVIYMMWSTNDLPDFIFALPMTAKTNQSALKDWVGTTLDNLRLGRPDLTQARKQDLLLMGPKRIVERW